MARERATELCRGGLDTLNEPHERQTHRQRVYWMCSQVDGNNVLDLNCAQGLAAILLGREGHLVESLTADPTSIVKAREALEAEPEYVRRNVSFRLASSVDSLYEDGVFDTILLSEGLERQTLPDRLLADMRRLLRPGGRAVISVPLGLHPDAGHAQTFYPSGFLKTVSPYFIPESLVIQNKYLCFAGRRRDDSSATDASELDSESLLQLSEQALRETELRLFEQQALFRKQMEHDRAAAAAKLEAWRSAARETLRHMTATALLNEIDLNAMLADRFRKVSDRMLASEPAEDETTALPECMHKLRESVERRLRELTNDCETKLRETGTLREQINKEKRATSQALRDERNLKARIRQQADQISYFKAEVNLKNSEVRYRLGDSLVRAATNPLDFLKLPVRLAKLYFLGVKRRRERKQLEQNENNRPGVIKAVTVSNDAASQTEPRVLIPAEPVATFNAVEIPQREPKLPVKMAAIMDEFTLACFKPECHVVTFSPDNWKQRLSAEKPDLLFVESAWAGNEGAWRYKINVSHQITDGPLFDLVQWCRQRGIPTVFWNKEDPPNFEHFINAAALFNHVFTTDENCIPAYRERLGHDRVYVLPFAAQGVIHNPINTQRDIVGDVCFAGSYYAKRHLERQQDMEILLKPALRHGLHIFDRMHGTTDERYMFPDAYRQAIQGSLSYPEMLDAYKRYRVFLNVNSVLDSPTMFSRRVLEILACGTPVISTPALGIDRLLGSDVVPLIENAEQAAHWLDILLKDRETADRMVLKAQRRIFTEHTVERRLRTVLDKLGIKYEVPQRRVTIITCTNRPAKLENIIANYERQNYADKEFILVLNSDDYSLEAVKERLKSVHNARAFQLPEQRTLGECLNKTIDEMQCEFWSKFDDDNFYGANFISDLMLPFGYTDAAVIGKYAYYAFMEGQNALALRYPGCEHQYVSLLSGSALIAERRLLEEIRFPDVNRGEDTQFLREAVARGFRLYSADRFNYVVRRAASTDEHTWKITQEEFLRHCQIMAYLEDFRDYVSV